jgi:hypothetical protein
MKALKTTTPFLVGLLFAFAGCATPPDAHWSGQIVGVNTMTSTKGI